MTFDQLRNTLQKMVQPVAPGSDGFESWIDCRDVLAFLAQELHGQVPAYTCSSESTPCLSQLYIYSVLVDVDRLECDYVDVLMNWDLSPSPGWSYGLSNVDGQRNKTIFHPLSFNRCPILAEQTPIFFVRNFPDGQSYGELHQEIAHLLEVHCRVEDGGHAYYRLDENGDYFQVAAAKGDENNMLCSLNWDDLEFYLYLADKALVRFFDVARLTPDAVGPDGKSEQFLEILEHRIHARYGLFSSGAQGGHEGAYLRGFQIIPRATSDDELYERLSGEKPREYVAFIAWDWKHRRVAECSCSPTHLANYFVESDLPFETSPAFFRPEVLSKFQQDPDKYQIDNWKIHCRGSWSLPYHINDEGQVHAYLIDLSHLPTNEQDYWRLFNESPRGGMAERAVKADFEGSWDLPYDPLDALKALLAQYPKVLVDGQPESLWTFDEDSFKRLTHMATDSRKEWEGFVLTASKLLVEGLDKKVLKRIATHLRCFDKDLRTINLLRNCLQALGSPEETVDAIIEPLGEIWDLRSKMGAAHRGGTVEAGPVQYRKASREMLERLDRAMKELADLIGRGDLNVQE